MSKSDFIYMVEKSAKRTNLVELYNHNDDL